MRQPEITPDMRMAARSHPGSWLNVIDPAFGPDEEVPPWGVVGAYPVDEAGEIRAEFRPNEGYRPSPKALRLPIPTNELERVMQLVHTGHRDRSALVPALREAALLVWARSPHEPGVTGFPGEDGRVLVPACSSAAHVPAAWPGVREVLGRDLAPLLAGHPLVVNPEGPITAVIPADHLVG